MPMLGRCMIFKKFHAWRNARACIKCSSWIVKEDGQGQHLTCKPNSCYFSLAINACHFLWLDKFLWLARVSSYGREEEEEEEEEEECFYVRQRDRKELDCMKEKGTWLFETWVLINFFNNYAIIYIQHSLKLYYIKHYNIIRVSHG